jgi:phage gp36-like protein
MLSAFDLASESTMSSIVIPAANSAEDLKKAATTPDGYLGGRYELMPFKTSVSVEIDDTNEVSDDIEYAQVQLVEKQIENARQRTESSMLANVVRGYFPTAVTDAIEAGTAEVLEGFSTLESIGKQAVEIAFGQIQQTFELVSVSLNSISHETTRYIESLSAENVGFNPEHGSIGSFHITDMQTTTNMTIVAHEQ